MYSRNVSCQGEAYNGICFGAAPLAVGARATTLGACQASLGARATALGTLQAGWERWRVDFGYEW